MRTLRHLAVAAAALVLLAAPAAGAQEHQGTVGYGGGAIWFGSFNDGSGAVDVSLNDGWIMTAQADHWLWGGRFGARVGAGFTQRPLQTIDESRDINTWLFTGDLLVRVLPVRPDRRVAPFLSAGGGMVSYGFGKGRPVVLEGADAVYPGDEERQAAVVVGLGIDILPRIGLFDTPLGIRLEAADHIALDSPFHSAAGDPYGPVHHFRVGASLIGLVELLP